MLISPEEGAMVAQRYEAQLRAGSERDILVEAVIRLSEFERLGVDPDELCDFVAEFWEALEQDRVIVVPEQDRLLGVTAPVLMRLAKAGAEAAKNSPDAGLRKDARTFLNAIKGTFRRKKRRWVPCWKTEAFPE